MYTEPRKPWIHRMLLWILGFLPERRTNRVLWDCGEFCMDVRDNVDPDFRYDWGNRSKGLGNRWYRKSVRDRHFFRRMYAKIDSLDMIASKLSIRDYGGMDTLDEKEFEERGDRNKED